MSDIPDRRASHWSGQALDRAFGRGAPEQLFYMMLQATRRRETAIGEALRELGLTVSRWRALAVIRRCGACTMSDLAHLSSVDRTTLTRTIDQLVNEGLVERAPSVSDRRLILLKLSAEGARLAELGSKANHDFCSDMLRGVPDDQRVGALRLLQQVVDNMIGDEDVAYGVLTFQPSRHTP